MTYSCRVSFAILYKKEKEIITMIESRCGIKCSACWCKGAI